MNTKYRQSIAICILYWPLLVFPSRFVWFDHWDMCQLEIPRVNFIANSIQNHGHFPLWDPHLWTGLPVLGSGQPGPLFPLTLLLEILPLQNGKISFLSLNIIFLLQRLLTAYFASLFFREIGIKSAALGGILFATGGYTGSLPWLDLSNAVVCLPLIALFAVRLARNPRSMRTAAALGLSLGFCWLSGHHEIPLIATYALLFGFGIRCWRMLPLSLAIAAAVSAIQTLPLLEFGHHAKRWIGLADPISWNQPVPYEIHARHSLHWRDLLNLLYPGATPESHTTMFVGLTAVTLALWAIAATWRTRRTQWLTLASGLSLLYALGASTPFHQILYDVLPALDKARTPTRGLVLFTLAISALVAIGFDRIIAERRVRIPFLALVFSVAAATFTLPHSALLGSGNHLTLAAIAAALMFCAGCFPALPKTALLAGGLLLELFTVTSLRRTDIATGKAVCATDLQSHDTLAKTIQAQGGRFALNDPRIRTSLGDLYQLDQFTSFVAGVPAPLLDLDLFSPPTQSLLGVRQTIHADRSITTQQALPRAWISHRAIRVDNIADLRTHIADAPQQAVLYAHEVLALSGSSISEPVTIERPNSDTVIMRSTLQSRGILTLSDADYPGWRATIDGFPAPILRTYGALRGVVVETDAHVIEMRYQPESVMLGAWFTIVGLLAAGLCLLTPCLLTEDAPPPEASTRTPSEAHPQPATLQNSPIAAASYTAHCQTRACDSAASADRNLYSP